MLIIDFLNRAQWEVNMSVVHSGSIESELQLVSEAAFRAQ